MSALAIRTGGVAKMKRMKVIVIFAALACASGAAWAFEEQQMMPAAPAAESAASPNSGSGLQITTPDLAAPKSDSGVKIRLPGLGVIGEIPKMDFGLELLYGASQPKQLEGDQSEPSGVMVRGRLPIKSR